MVLAQLAYCMPGIVTSLGFHPTMVLAQHMKTRSTVSPVAAFPSHYGSRSTTETYYCLAEHVEFPSHYGSRSTKSNTEPGYYAISVSIPLWFSLNQQQVNDYKQYAQTVSIPLWFSLNTAINPLTGNLISVSIPLWFSLNLF